MKIVVYEGFAYGFYGEYEILEALSDYSGDYSFKTDAEDGVYEGDTENWDEEGFPLEKKLIEFRRVEERKEEHEQID